MFIMVISKFFRFKRRERITDEYEPDIELHEEEAEEWFHKKFIRVSSKYTFIIPSIIAILWTDHLGFAIYITDLLNYCSNAKNFNFGGTISFLVLIILNQISRILSDFDGLIYFWPWFKKHFYCEEWIPHEFYQNILAYHTYYERDSKPFFSEYNADYELDYLFISNDEEEVKSDEKKNYGIFRKKSRYTFLHLGYESESVTDSLLSTTDTDLEFFGINAEDENYLFYDPEDRFPFYYDEEKYARIFHKI